MDATKLLTAIAKLRPYSSLEEHLRLALVIATQQDEFAPLGDATTLERRIQETVLQLQATTDQHAAVSNELESLAAMTPCEFTPNHMWTLVRALRVQSQIINLYVGQ